MKAILFQNRELETAEVPVWKILIISPQLTEQIQTDQQQQQTPLWNFMNIRGIYMHFFFGGINKFLLLWAELGIWGSCFRWYY